MSSKYAKPRIELSEVRASFTPDDSTLESWSGRMTQRVVTHIIQAGDQRLDGTKRIEWSRPVPAIDYFPVAEGELIVGDKRCRAFWSSDRFVHAGGWTD